MLLEVKFCVTKDLWWAHSRFIYAYHFMLGATVSGTVHFPFEIQRSLLEHKAICGPLAILFFEHSN